MGRTSSQARSSQACISPRSSVESARCLRQVGPLRERRRLRRRRHRSVARGRRGSPRSPPRTGATRARPWRSGGRSRAGAGRAAEVEHRDPQERPSPEVEAPLHLVGVPFDGRMLLGLAAGRRGRGSRTGADPCRGERRRPSRRCPGGSAGATRRGARSSARRPCAPAPGRARSAFGAGRRGSSGRDRGSSRSTRNRATLGSSGRGASAGARSAGAGTSVRGRRRRWPEEAVAGPSPARLPRRPRRPPRCRPRCGPSTGTTATAGWCGSHAPAGSTGTGRRTASTPVNVGRKNELKCSTWIGRPSLGTPALMAATASAVRSVEVGLQ